MSIQFRTKSRTSINYSSFIGNSGLTGCCYVYENNEVVQNQNYTLSQCNQQDGLFKPGTCDPTFNLLPSSMGCCCACSLKEETGNPLSSLTLCECESISGKWTLGSCDNLTENEYCISGTQEQSNTIDFRNKKACCHPSISEDGTVFSDCTDVCSEKECAEKAIVPYTATYYNNGRVCDVEVGSAASVRDECKLSESSKVILNSCENGTNLFCWNKGGQNRCDFKYEFSDILLQSLYPGSYFENVNQYVVQLKNFSSPQNLSIAILGSQYGSSFPDIEDFAKSLLIRIKKICPGSLSFDNSISEPDKWIDGYFALMDNNNIPRYYSSPNYISNNFENSANSPIPTQTPIAPVKDLIATRTFSAWIDSSNNVKIFGRFYSGSLNQYKTFSISTKLKKIYQHNLAPVGFDTHQSIPEYSTVGFVGQKLDGTFEYFSPFISQIQQLQQIQQIIRSLPPKDYVNASFGNSTFCGIEADGTMSCVSLNNELLQKYPINKKYKLVSCTSALSSEFSGINNPNNEYCFAVDEDNKFVKMSSQLFEFYREPSSSNTDVIGLSCYNNYCLSVVEPDENICNSQLLGSCCTCTEDITNCIQTIQGTCLELGGDFTSGGICCNLNQTENCINCSNIPNCNNFTIISSTSSESDLPTSELTYYKDGLYVGIFEPGSPINQQGSIVNGNPYTGNALNYRPNVVGYGTTSKKWAIIVSPSDYELNYLNEDSENQEIIPASIYDGLWNTYGNNNEYFGIMSKTMQTLREKSRLSGWYLPSKNELEFINKQINHGFFIPEIFKSLKNEIYLTSTPYFKINSDTIFDIDKQIFEGNSFMYGQNFSKLDYGTIYLVPRTKNVNVRLIRRIELE
jgi:hypothetical protein